MHYLTQLIVILVIFSNTLTGCQDDSGNSDPITGCQEGSEQSLHEEECTYIGDCDSIGSDAFKTWQECEDDDWVEKSEPVDCRREVSDSCDAALCGAGDIREYYDGGCEYSSDCDETGMLKPDTWEECVGGNWVGKEKHLDLDCGRKTEGLSCGDRYTCRNSKCMTYGISGDPSDWDFREVELPFKPIGAVEFVDDQGETKIIAGSVNGIWISGEIDEKGLSNDWNHQPGDYTSELVVSPHDMKTVFVSATRSRGTSFGPSKIHRSLDAGKNWDTIHDFQKEIALTTYISPNMPTRVYFVIHPGSLPVPQRGLFISNDLGESIEFLDFQHNDNSDLMVHDILEMPGTSTLFVSTEHGRHEEPYPSSTRPPLFRSKDGGLTWENIKLAKMWHALDLRVNSKGRFYFFGEGHFDFWTDDEGDTWTNRAR